MIDLEAHRARVLAAAAQLPPVELPLTDALGLVLAEPIATRWPVPLFDNSAMDGYAVRGADATEGAVLRVVADVPAGSADDPDLGPGEAARIMTGAPVPSAADAVVPLEATAEGTEVRATPPAQITVTAEPKPGAHIRREGEDARAGTEVVAAGTRLGARDLSSIASAGHDRVRVVPAARVAIISTGSELVPPGATPQRGQIPESNSVLLAGCVREAGAEVASVHIVPDDDDALRAVVEGLDVDVVILSGGASVGSFDVVKSVLGELPDVRFDKVAMQPGKPQGFGTLPGGALAFCLPGNPVSVAVSFEMFVRPALLQLAGVAQIDRPRVTRRALAAWKTPVGRAQVLPVVLEGNGVRPSARGGSGSHLVASLGRAEAYALIPADVERVEEGDDVIVMELT
ncbi:molybdopterin molybdotransferase MoeA [Gulosibacter faecalis]|uniref:Molybdopterin molybdenumtransferase n=1 Tax=Gulosibacter faecalis TaxID=272240 RepID=A0ABW5UYY1_9MICO|nr:gephyrin-like molybdotransferase Glp [Gulosibacter faecalis]